MGLTRSGLLVVAGALVAVIAAPGLYEVAFGLPERYARKPGTRRRCLRRQRIRRAGGKCAWRCARYRRIPA